MTRTEIAALTGRWGSYWLTRTDRSCRYCGRFNDGKDHPVTVCLCCGSPQCLVPRECGICLVGSLLGASIWPYDQRECGYKGCANEAVAKAPRVRRVCRDHLSKVTRRFGGKTIILADEIAERVAELGQTSGVPEWRRRVWIEHPGRGAR